MSAKNVERKPGFEHVCVIQGLLLGDVPAEQFERELGAMLGVRVQYLETVLTLPDRDERGAPVPETGDRSDVLFAYHRDDYSPEFNAKRMARGIRWFEDALSPRNNPNGLIYPARVREYVDPKVWALMGLTAPTEARRYSPKERYAVGDVLAHPTFGTGQVVEVLRDNKVSAQFPAGAKILVHGR